MAVTLKRPSESCTQGLSEGAPLIRVFGAIAVRSASGARKRVLWAEDSKDGERGKGVEAKTEESGGAEKRRCGCKRSRLARAFTHGASETTVTELTRRQSGVTVRCTVGVLFVAAVLFGVWLAVAVGYGLGSAPGQDPGP